ncbi:MAG: tyrosine-type recombinase/integrase [Halolamina sp.]
MADPGTKIERLRERIEAGGADGEHIAEPDRRALMDFSDEMYLRQSDYSDHRHAKLLRHTVRMAEAVGGLADAFEDRDAAEKLVAWINRTYDNEETNRDYRIALRVFGRRATERNGDEPPESLAWIPSGTSNTYDPAPTPAEMLTWEDDVIPMIESTENYRDAALLAVAWDAGPRSGELRNLRIGDVTDHRHGRQITVEGKTGQRTVTLVPSVPYLDQWLDNHPRGDEATAPLWCEFADGTELSYNGFARVFQRAADRAAIEKPTTPTNFRKSSASYLASQGGQSGHP